MAKCLTIVDDAGRIEVESELRRQICKVGRCMCASGFVVACQGNLSVRVDQDRILVTPARVCKGHLEPQDLLVTDRNGVVKCGSCRPSSEILMHLLFYRLRPDVQAVCHAHPPTATGFAAAGRALDVAVLPDVVVDLGTIPLAPYGTPGTWELCESLQPLVGKHHAILLENHGVVTCGQDLTRAYQRLETVEQFARILLTAHCLGGPHVLSNINVQKLNRREVALRSVGSGRRNETSAHIRISGRANHRGASKSSYILMRTLWANCSSARTLITLYADNA